MKYIFVVHSHLTMLISLAIIKLRKLNKDDIIFVSFNVDFKPSYSYLHIYNIKPIRSRSSGNILKFVFKSFNFSKYLDLLVSQLVQESNFELFINYGYYPNNLLITHRLCSKFNFFEEGMDSYKNCTLVNLAPINTETGFRLSVRERLKYSTKFFLQTLRGRLSPKLNALPINPSAYSCIESVTYYCFSKYSFPDVPINRKTICDIKFNYNSSLKLKDNSLVIIGENVVNYYNVSINSYVKAIESGLSKVLNSYSFINIYLKFHPRETKQCRQATILMLKALNLNFEIIPDSESLEVLLAASSNNSLLGLSSTLLFYGKILGHKPYSYQNYIESITHIAKDNIYWKYVESI